MLLDKPMPAPQLKQWLIGLNFSTPLLRESMTLTKTGNSIHWPLDTSASQNDKLIYIASPVLKGVKDPLKNQPRITLVRKDKERLSITAVPTVAKNRESINKRIDELRATDGLPKRKTQYKMHSGMEVLVKPDVCSVTEIKQERGFVYFNLNGGDSWAYYHPENNPEFIFNFKGEPIYLTKELLPEYWEQLHHQPVKADSQGVLKLAFIDPATDRYWRGTYDSVNDELELEPTKSSKVLMDFAKANGIQLPDGVIPEWRLVFDPHDSVRVDIDNRVINTFQLSSFMKAQAKPIAHMPKTIRKVIEHVCGNDTDSYNHFVNWLAYVLQERDRPLTAWVFHGIPGTGKGTLVAKILRPLFGLQHSTVIRMKQLDEKFNDFIENNLLITVDEVETNALSNERGAMADLRMYITDEFIPVRRMHATARLVRNYTAWIFCSNASAPVRVTKDDRRFNVAKYQPNKIVLTEKDLATIERELQPFHDFLLALKVDRAKVFNVLQNADRDTLMDLTESSADSVANALLKGDMEFFIDQLPTDSRYLGSASSIAKVEDYKNVIKSLLERTDMNDGRCNIARDELRAIFEYTVGKIPDSPNKFTSFVKHHRITTERVRVDGEPVYGLKVQWRDLTQWPRFKRLFAPTGKPELKAVGAKG
jgi:hypothetical protein